MSRELFHRRICDPRWLALLLSAAIFVLPLHFHVVSAAASQINKECSCLHGSRTQAGLASAPSASLPLLAIGEVALLAQVHCGSHLLRIPSSRAPPPSVSR